jgi:SAM-dependent methyltransferase
VSTDDWNRHWRAFAESAALNPAQAYRRLLIFRALDLASASKPVRLLEIGSGQGDLSRELKERYPNIELVGLDLSDAGVEIARAKVPSAAFFQQDLTRPMALPERYRGWATHAVCSEVLEHLDDPRAALENARSCLAPRGRLVVTVPAGPMSAFDHHIGHRRHFGPEQLRRVLEGAGLEVVSLHGAGFPFFNLYRLTVVARGRKLITDLDSERPLPTSARAAMRVFSKLFGLNVHEGLRGWQLVATAVEPGAARDSASLTASHAS